MAKRPRKCKPFETPEFTAYAKAEIEATAVRCGSAVCEMTRRELAAAQDTARRVARLLRDIAAVLEGDDAALRS